MMMFFWVLALKMETVCFSETLASIDEPTQRKNPEHHHQYLIKFPRAELIRLKPSFDSNI
jgi:hypothetical protein